MADKIKKLYGVEIIEPAIVNARKNASLNGITNVNFEASNTMNPKRIVYVSCNVAILARDIEIFERTTNYRLVKAQMVDLFKRTNHVEAVSLEQSE